MAKREENYEQEAEAGAELIKQGKEKLNKAKIDGYLKKADKVGEMSLAEKGAMYAYIGRIAGDNYSWCTDKARKIAHTLALKHDRDGATYVRSQISRKDTSEYAKKLVDSEKYAEAGMAYFMAGDYTKSEKMMEKAKKTGNIMGAYKIMGQFLLKEIATLKQMGLLGDKYEKQQSGEQESQE
jgi:hypothetical protein